MASLVFSAAGSALGGALGGTVGASLGRLAGALGGALIDRRLFASTPGNTNTSRSVEGPRLKDFDVISSTEGAPIPRVYGRARVSGQVIWATRFQEEVIVTSSTTETRNASSGGKGGGGGGSTSTVTTTTTSYAYFGNLAVALCEGPIANIGRVWADGKLLSMDTITVRLHTGTEDQPADPLIVAKQGEVNTPAYRGTAYVVFEHLPLEPFGNRIPQLSFEVIRPIGELERAIRAVVLIPGATEFGYDPRILVRDGGQGKTLPETRHTYSDSADFMVSLNDLQAICPNLERVALVVSWFGDDLRAANCTIRPKVERFDKTVPGAEWSVAGLGRSQAQLVSTYEGNAAYGGTPSDDSVIRAIRELNRRGLKVTLYPFVMMDIPAANLLTDPWTGAAAQPAYPWRGKITCHPAQGRAGSPYGTSALDGQISAFLGAASPAHYGQSGEAVTYSGPNEWSYRRMVLHMAKLAQIAGGVESFIIGSELVSLTHLRGAGASFPMVAGLAALANDVKAMLPSTSLTYAADWTEYGAKPEGNDLYFPLDTLWSSSSIAAVGIDYYPPLSDWRDGATHADREISSTIYDEAYLRSRIYAGEAYDFYYASDANRKSQLRTPITDGFGKPWVFRQKDIRSWWSNTHIERRGGAETTATGWIAGSKPIWITEFGVPAVDKGSNQPSVFPDPKSSTAGVPYQSSGLRDDLIQRRTIHAVLTHFDAALGGQVVDNPHSPVYGGPMLDPSRLYLWAWDARPYPAFPRASTVWVDGSNWRTGHWLNGRLATASVGEFMKRILEDYAISAAADPALSATIDGYIIDRPMSARSALSSLSQIFAVQANEEMGVLQLSARATDASADLTVEDIVADGKQSLFSAKRGQESELPIEVTLAFTDTDDDYQVATVSSRRLSGQTKRSQSIECPAIASRLVMGQQAETMLQDIWAGRETLTITLPPSQLGLIPGDAIAFSDGTRERTFLVESTNGAFVRNVECRALPALSHSPPALAEPDLTYDLPPSLGAPLVYTLDLPTISGREGVLTWVAATATPWPGALTIWRGTESTGFVAVGSLGAASIIGEMLNDLAVGPIWRWDRKNSIRVRLATGSMSSLPEERVLAGGNVIAVDTGNGWEMLQFLNADLVGPQTYLLSGLLRGAGNSEAQVTALIPAGAAVVVLDGAVQSLVRDPASLGNDLTFRIGPSRYDHGHSSQAQLDVTPGDIALRPLAPVHLRAARQADGIALSWIRRARVGGDAWNILEVPISEDREAYRVSILSASGDVLRSIDVSESSFLYAAAQELADFGTTVSQLRFSVRQVSPLVGEGFATETTRPL